MEVSPGVVPGRRPLVGVVEGDEGASEFGVQLAEQRRLASLARTVDDGHPEVSNTLLDERPYLPLDQLSWLFSFRHEATLALDARCLRFSRAWSSRFAGAGFAFRGRFRRWLRQ